MSDNKIPLALIAAELNVGVAKLVGKLDGQIGFDPATGLRVVSAATCRRLIDEKAAADAAKAELAARRRAEHQARRAELDTRNPLRGGIPASPNSTAYADMIAADQR